MTNSESTAKRFVPMKLRTMRASDPEWDRWQKAAERQRPSLTRCAWLRKVANQAAGGAE